MFFYIILFVNFHAILPFLYLSSINFIFLPSFHPFRLFIFLLFVLFLTSFIFLSSPSNLLLSSFSPFRPQYLLLMCFIYSSSYPSSLHIFNPHSFFFFYLIYLLFIFFMLSILLLSSLSSFKPFQCLAFVFSSSTSS